MNVVVTGTGRSGTGWAAATLNAAGVRCGHEEMFHPTGRIHRPDLDADSSYLAVPYLANLDCRRVLLLRDPEATVRSLVRLGGFHDPAHTLYTRAVTDVIGPLPPSPWAEVIYIREWVRLAAPHVDAVCWLTDPSDDGYFDAVDQFLDACGASAGFEAAVTAKVTHRPAVTKAGLPADVAAACRHVAEEWEAL